MSYRKVFAQEVIISALKRGMTRRQLQSLHLRDGMAEHAARLVVNQSIKKSRKKGAR